MRRCGRIVIAILITAGWLAVAAAQDPDIVNAAISDGTGAPPPVDGVRRIDLQGRFLLTGLIDARTGTIQPGLEADLLVVSDGHVAFERP